MAVTPSNMVPLGMQAPDFELFDTVSKRDLSLEALKSDVATVIMFICNHCPFVKHVESELIKLSHEYQAKGISFIAISSNDVNEYPEDSSEKMSLLAAEKRYPFPIFTMKRKRLVKRMMLLVRRIFTFLIKT